MAKKENDGLKKLKIQLRDHTIGRLYLFFGEEEFLISYYSQALRDKVLGDGMPEFNYSVFEGAKIDWDRVNEAVEQLPVMNDKKFVLIKGSGIFKSANEAVKSFWQQRIKDLPDYVCIAFIESEIDRRGVLYKAVAAAGETVECNYLEGVELSNWVLRGCREAGKEIGPKEVAYLINSCDHGMNSLKRELEKLFAYCADKITIQDIDKIVSKLPQNRVFEMVNAMMEKDAASVFARLDELKTLKESAIRILSLLCTSFEKILHAKVLLERSAMNSEIASSIKVPPYFVRGYTDAAKRFSKPFLRGAICRCAEINFDVKLGKCEEWLALERFLSDCMV